MMLLLILCLLISLPSLPSFALEPQNPLSLCSRFIEGADRDKCEARLTKLSPDWYLATVCNENFDDQLFYDCVDLSKAGSFDPKKLDDCVGDQLNDNARIQCVKNAKTGEPFQSAKLVTKKTVKPKKK